MLDSYSVLELALNGEKFYSELFALYIPQIPRRYTLDPRKLLSPLVGGCVVSAVYAKAEPQFKGPDGRVDDLS